MPCGKHLGLGDAIALVACAEGERWSVVQSRLKRRGDDVVAPPRTRLLDYSTIAAACQQSMHSGRQTSRHRWVPPRGPWSHLYRMEYSPCELGTG